MERAFTKYVSTFKSPQLIVTDHETTFRSLNFQEFLQTLGTSIEYASSSESNGQVERAHSTMIEIFNTNKHKFPNYATKTIVNLCANFYNNTVQSTSTFTPNEIIFNETGNATDPEQLQKIYEELKKKTLAKQNKILKDNQNRENPPVIKENQEVVIIPNIRKKKDPRANEAIAKGVENKTFKINNNVKRTKNKIKRVKNH